MLCHRFPDSLFKRLTCMTVPEPGRRDMDLEPDPGIGISGFPNPDTRNFQDLLCDEQPGI